MKHQSPLTLLAAVLATSLAAPSMGQAILSLDGTRTVGGTSPNGTPTAPYHLTSSTMDRATDTLLAAGFTISTSPSFRASQTGAADVLFTGLVDVAFTAQEIADAVAFVNAGGSLVMVRDAGTNNEVDALSQAFGVTYNGNPSGFFGGVAHDVDETVSHPIWSGPAGSVSSYQQIFASSIASGADSIGVHATDGRSALGVLDFGAGRVVCLTDISCWIDSSIVSGPRPGTPLGTVWENIFRWAADGSDDPIGISYCDPAVANSTGSPAQLAAFGSVSVIQNDITLNASDLPMSSFGFFIVGSSRGFAANPGGSAGNLCVGGSIGRYVGPGEIQNSGPEGAIELALDLTSIPRPNGPVSSSAGDLWTFQAWYRDTVASVPTSNFTNAVEITLQ